MIRHIETLICDGCGLRKENDPEDAWLGAQHEADTCQWLTVKKEYPIRHYCPECKVPVKICEAKP